MPPFGLRRIVKKWLYLLVVLLASCSSDDGERENTLVYTGTFISITPGMIASDEVYYEDIQPYIDIFGATLTYGKDTTFFVGSDLAIRDSITLAVKDNRGELSIIHNEQSTMHFVEHTTQILQFTAGEYEHIGKRFVVCKDSVYAVDGGWRLLLNDGKFIMHRSKGNDYERQINTTAVYWATGSLNGQNLVLTNNDTIYQVQDVGSYEISLYMYAPVREYIGTLERQ